MQVGDLKFNLYENAIDSLKHAIEHYTQDADEKRRYKYTILHLAQGVQLLLKERLRQEHPNFVFTNVVDDTKTVDIDMTISRLEKIARVNLGSAKSLIQELAGVRNRIEHYAVTVSKPQVDSIVGRTVPFLVAFTRDELHREFEREIGYETWQALLRIRAYLMNAIRAAELKIREDGKPAHYCVRCQANTATETSYGASEWDLQYVVAACLVCLDDVFIRTHCRNCGAKIVRKAREASSYRFLGDRLTADPVVPNYSYCDECKSRLGQEYPGLRIAAFAAEVRRWFEKHDFVTTKDLISLLSNVSTAGPTSRYLYPEELYKAGVIDFEYPHEKERYHATRQISPWYGFDDHVRFKWSMQDRKVVE